MRRAVTLVLLVLLASPVAWWWWTRPPRASDESLREALAFAPASADGAVAIADPARAARFLARRPQTAVLAFAAAPRAVPAFKRLQPVAAAVVAAARGPVVAWWEGGGAAVGARVRPGARAALTELAAASGLAAAAGNEWVAIATSTELLAGGTAAVSPVAGGPPAAAIAHVGGRLWRVQVRSRSVDAESGSGASLPPDAGTSFVRVSEPAALLAPFGVASAALGPMCVVVGEHDAWGVALPSVRLEGALRRLLGGGEHSTASPATWNGLLGEVSVVEGDGTTIASTPVLLPSLEAAAGSGEEGLLHGRHAARLLARAAAAAERIPGLGAQARSLSDAAALADGLDTVRFRLDAAGGRILLTW